MRQTKNSLRKTALRFPSSRYYPIGGRKTTWPLHKDRQMNPQAISEKIHPIKKGSAEIPKQQNFPAAPPMGIGDGKRKEPRRIGALDLFSQEKSTVLTACSPEYPIPLLPLQE